MTRDWAMSSLISSMGIGPNAVIFTDGYDWVPRGQMVKPFAHPTRLRVPKQELGNQPKIKNETGFSQLLHIPLHRSPAETIRLHQPDEPEGDAMDTR